MTLILKRLPKKLLGMRGQRSRGDGDRRGRERGTGGGYKGQRMEI